jgi:hypothetical protein
MSCEEQAQAGEASFGFGEFAHGDCYDMETSRYQYFFQH